MKFRLISQFKPKGDQPKAIKKIVENFKNGSKNQVLLGVTGSGKTFTMANVISQLNRPALIISPNKVLAAQLYSEFKTFFPYNHVEYFISYYDYYQPEAYIPQTDTYIEKDADINEQIDKLRIKATSSVLNFRDTIVIASVSCIYNIGTPQNFEKFSFLIYKNMKTNRNTFIDKLVKMGYIRDETNFKRNTFRIRGNIIDIFPSDSDTFLRIEIDEKIKSITEMEPLNITELKKLNEFIISPVSHFITDEDTITIAIKSIKKELDERYNQLIKEGKTIYAERLKQRTLYDIELLQTTGYCHGIENYTRHLTQRPPGSRPICLLDYFPSDYILFIDESHIAIPQIRGMYEGDRSRKQTLVDYGFRLPSALDNRPLKFDEFETLRPQTCFVSATPQKYELSISKGKIVEQIIRPTGLVDPEIEIHPYKDQIKKLIYEINERIKNNERTLVLTLTKKTSEDLATYLNNKGIKSAYIHSSMDTLERIEIIERFRKGEFHVLVGINLLREGIDIPEVSLVAILNADVSGFLRNDTTIIQIAGRAARNKCGKVILFADDITQAMKNAIDETNRRRKIQINYNKKHNITPQTIQKSYVSYEELKKQKQSKTIKTIEETLLEINKNNITNIIEELEKQMKEAAENLNFELAIELRDRIKTLKEMKTFKHII
ncbi:MAG: excinuclease ABC subunit UvrB [Elusimicrobiales bacterium]|nr:excinuclease ABC subunit UvrB [Elusimicrobiales bacterium]